MGQQLLAVVGATCTQGGGLARAAPADASRRFRVRALTRRPESEPARGLAANATRIPLEPPPVVA